VEGVTSSRRVLRGGRFGRFTLREEFWVGKQARELRAIGLVGLRRCNICLAEGNDHLVALNAHSGGRIHPDPYGIALGLENRDDNVVTDENALSPLTCQDQHVASLSHSLRPADGQAEGVYRVGGGGFDARNDRERRD
jgi:hypothetical protein